MNRNHRFPRTGLKVFLSSLILLLVLTPALNASFVAAQLNTSREDQLLKTALDYVEKNRKGTGEIRFIDEITGKPVSGTGVQHQQITHDFMFSTHFWGDPDRMRWLGLEWSGDVWLSWSEIQPTSGVYDYNKPDGTISWLKQKQVHVWARFTSLLFDWNHLESPRPPSFADFDHIDDPVVFARYKDLVYEFVFNVAAHYKGTISAYMTQIEINWPGHVVDTGFSKRPLWTIQQAVELNKIVSKAIRDADPNATIILGTSTTWQGPSANDVDPMQFTKLCLASGVDVDVVALEAYPFDGSPAFFYDYVKKLAKLGKPVFINETGYPSAKPDADESWVRSWKWHVFNEHVQALWFRYVIMLALGMKEVTGVSILFIRDADPTSLYSTSMTHVFDTMGLYTVTWQPKESAKMLRELMVNFTTSGTTRTDINGTIAVRGFAGNYTVRVSGYEPVTIHISEGTTEDLTVSLSREKTSEYNDAAKAVESASVALSALRSRDLKTQEAKNLTEAAAIEYELAAASLDRWDLDAAQTHAGLSQQLANQAFQAEALYQQQQDYLKFSAVLVAMVLIVAVIAVSLVKSRTAPKTRKEDAAAS